MKKPTTTVYNVNKKIDSRVSLTFLLQ